MPRSRRLQFQNRFVSLNASAHTKHVSSLPLPYPYYHLPSASVSGKCSTPITVGAKCDDKKVKTSTTWPYLTLPYMYCTCVCVCVCVCLFVCIQQDVDSFPMHPLLIIPWRVPADDKCDAKAVCKGVDKCSGKLCKAKSQCHAPGKCVFKTGLCSNPFAPKTLKCDDKNDKTGVNLCLDPFFFQPCRCSRCFFMISYGFFVFFVTDHL